MSYFTTDFYETKRELIIFSEKLAQGLSKSNKKFLMNMLYGIAKNQSCLLSQIARALDEDVKLANVINRLIDQMIRFSDSDMKIVQKNYHDMIMKYIPGKLVINLDNSEIVKEYANKLEDLDRVVDGSSTRSNDIKPRYHICEVSMVTKNEKQPLSLYSLIYSTKSKGFKSMNDEIIKSILAVKEVMKNDVRL